MFKLVYIFRKYLLTKCIERQTLNAVIRFIWRSHVHFLHLNVMIKYKFFWVNEILIDKKREFFPLAMVFLQEVISITESFGYFIYLNLYYIKVFLFAILLRWYVTDTRCSKCGWCTLLNRALVHFTNLSDVELKAFLVDPIVVPVFFCAALIITHY